MGQDRCLLRHRPTATATFQRTRAMGQHRCALCRWGTSNANETDPASTRALEFLDHFQFVPAGVEVVGDALPGGREAPVLVSLSCASVVLIQKLIAAADTTGHAFFATYGRLNAESKHQFLEIRVCPNVIA